MKPRIAFLSLAAAMLGSTLPALAGPITFSYQYISVPGSQTTGLTGITNSGVVLGTSYSPYLTFTLFNGIRTGVPWNGLIAAGINDAGAMVGNGYCGNSQIYTGCLLSPEGSFTLFPDVILTDINNNGVMVGSQSGRAVRIVNGITEDLGLPGESRATGLNDLGQIVGWYQTGGFGSLLYGFVWSNGTYEILNAPYANSGQGLVGINNAGIVAADDYVYVNGQWIYLGDPSTDFQMQLTDINDSNVMVGWNGYRGVIITMSSVPEPASGALAAVGVIFLLYRHRLKSRR